MYKTIRLQIYKKSISENAKLRHYEVIKPEASYASETDHWKQMSN